METLQCCSCAGGALLENPSMSDGEYLSFFIGEGTGTAGQVHAWGCASVLLWSFGNVFHTQPLSAASSKINVNRPFHFDHVLNLSKFICYNEHYQYQIQFYLPQTTQVFNFSITPISDQISDQDWPWSKMAQQWTDYFVSRLCCKVLKKTKQAQEWTILVKTKLWCDLFLNCWNGNIRIQYFVWFSFSLV